MPLLPVASELTLGRGAIMERNCLVSVLLVFKILLPLRYQRGCLTILDAEQTNNQRNGDQWNLPKNEDVAAPETTSASRVPMIYLDQI